MQSDTKRLLSSFPSSEISIVNRDKNKLAHELAAIARRTGDFSMVTNAPLDARDVMRDEYVSPVVQVLPWSSKKKNHLPNSSNLRS